MNKGAPPGAAGGIFLPKDSQRKDATRPLGPPGIINVDQLKKQRREQRQGNQIIYVEPDRRRITRDGQRVTIQHDEMERFRRIGIGPARVERRGGEFYNVVTRPGGYQIITVMDANGRLLRRIRRDRFGNEVILIDNRARVVGPAGFFLGLAAPVIGIPRERYIVDYRDAPAPLLYETLMAPAAAPIERAYSLDEIRNNAPLRAVMPRIDVNTINFASGAWEISPDQYGQLDRIAQAITEALTQNPNEVFMIEGHTDKVGDEVSNLSLSDRRAAAVAEVLTNNYQIPPENLTTQGFGESQPKEPVDGPSIINRRVTVLRITPLLTGQAQ